MERLAVVLLAAIAASIVQPPTPRAQATVRIIRPIRVARETWSRLPPKQRREVVVIKDGQPIMLRLMEFE